MFILITLVISQLTFSPFSFLNFSPETVLLQTLVLYYLYRLSAVINVFQLAGYSALFLLSLGAYLFWLQFDVFACFLLVAESIVILFVLSLLMHLNYTNLSEKPLKTISLLWVLPTTLLVTQLSTNHFTYWVDWYSSQTSQFNDLLPQFLFFYVLDSPLVFLTGLWLLFLTFLLVQIVLSVSLKKSSSSTELVYTRKTQNIWAQWYKKPLLRFFNKN